MRLCNVQEERRGTVRKAGNDKLASLALQELAKCKSTKCNDKCIQIIIMSAGIMQYTSKNYNE